MRTWSFNRRAKRNNKQIEEAQAPDGTVKVYFLDGSHKIFDCSDSSLLVGQLLEEVKLPWSIGKLDVKTQLVNGSHSQAQDHVTVICCRKKKLAGFTKAQGLMARLLIAAKKKELLEAAEKGDGAAAVEALVEKAKEGKDGEAPGAAE